MPYPSRKPLVPSPVNGSDATPPPAYGLVELHNRYSGKYAIVDVSIDVTGSTKASHAVMHQRFTDLCRTTASEFSEFKEHVLVRGSYVSGGLWPGSLVAVHEAALPAADFGGGSPLIASEVESWKLLKADLQRVSEQAAIVQVVKVVISDFHDTSTGDRAPKIAELRAVQNEFPNVQIVLVAPDDGFDPVVAKIFQRESNDTSPVMLVDAMAGGVRLFELLADQLRSASRSVSNVDIKPGFRLKK